MTERLKRWTVTYKFRSAMAPTATEAMAIARRKAENDVPGASVRILSVRKGVRYWMVDVERVRE
jgi:hypothetical protein